MKTYEVNLISDGVTSAIDTVIAPDDYTAGDYIEDCVKNADEAWIEMILRGVIVLVDVTEA